MVISSAPGPVADVEDRRAVAVRVQRDPVLDAGRPERVPGRVVVGPDPGPAADREVDSRQPGRRGPPDHLDALADVPRRDVEQPKEPLRVRRAEIGQPPVVDIAPELRELKQGAVEGVEGADPELGAAAPRQGLAVLAAVVDDLGGHAVAVHVRQAGSRVVVPGARVRVPEERLAVDDRAGLRDQRVVIVQVPGRAVAAQVLAEPRAYMRISRHDDDRRCSDRETC